MAAQSSHCIAQSLQRGRDRDRQEQGEPTRWLRSSGEPDDAGWGLQAGDGSHDSHPPVILPPPQPAPDQGLDPVAMGAQHQVRRLLGRRQK